MTQASGGTGRVVERAVRRIGWQVGAAVAVIVVALAAVAVVLTECTQYDTDKQLVQQAAANAEDVDDPPPWCWIVLLTAAGQIETTQGIPPSAADPAALRRAVATGAASDTERDIDGGHYLVHTLARQGGAIQVVLDLGPADRRLTTLLTGFGLAAGGGLLLACVVGWALARRVLAPLRRVLTLQRQFVADASHELRTPLTLLHTRLQLLHRGLTTDEDKAQSVEDVSALLGDSNRLVELVDDLLLAADPPTAPDLRPVHLTELVDDVLAAARPLAARCRVELTGDVDGDPVARGSASALRRALIAMLDNAIEHTPPGGVVTVKAKQAKKIVRIEVADNGAGFDQATAGRLFDRFHSGAHGTRRRHGLGLALVSDVVDRHGGHIEVQSDPGEGAKFTVTIPSALAT